jgi:signal transduction histidine kinase
MPARGEESSPHPPSGGIQRVVEDSAELRASRTRLVEGAQAERRRLERALHDGVQQDLIAISMRLQFLKEVLETDVPRALELLGEARVDTRDALDRVRVLAGDVYPSLLPVWGLPDSVREAARASGVPVRVVTVGVGRYPAEVESALYFCCRAALQQAAPDTELRLSGEDHALRLEFVPAVGADLTAVRDLVGAAGGVLGEPLDGGAAVVATIAL